MPRLLLRGKTGTNEKQLVMDSNRSNEFQQRLAELQAIFHQQLPGKIDDIHHSWQRLCSHWDAEELTRLHRMSHSMAGSGGTFGAHEVGRAARTLEQQLKALSATGIPPDAMTHQQLEHLISALSNTCDAWCPDGR